MHLSIYQESSILELADIFYKQQIVSELTCCVFCTIQMSYKKSVPSYQGRNKSLLRNALQLMQEVEQDERITVRFIAALARYLLALTSDSTMLSLSVEVTAQLPVLSMLAACCCSFTSLFAIRPMMPALPSLPALLLLPLTGMSELDALL